MGAPKVLPAEIPFLSEDLSHLSNGAWALLGYVAVAVNLGNPHIVLCVEDIETAPVAHIGAELESHWRFPERVNVGFVQVIDAHNIKVRVFERGSGETLACGSGACAAVVATGLLGLTTGLVQVALRGGDLQIRWAGAGHSVWMTGAATRVFAGTIEVPVF
jgi:diaminopimelate epimerase